MLLIFFSEIIACWLLNILQQKLRKSVGKYIFYGLLHDMPMGANGRRNDGVTAPKTQQLYERLGHINRTLHADIEKPTSLEKYINNLHKINFMLWKKKIVEKICIWLLAQHSTVKHNKQYTTQQTIHNTKYIVVI